MVKALVCEPQCPRLESHVSSKPFQPKAGLPRRVHVGHYPCSEQYTCTGPGVKPSRTHLTMSDYTRFINDIIGHRPDINHMTGNNEGVLRYERGRIGPRAVNGESNR